MHAMRSCQTHLQVVGLMAGFAWNSERGVALAAMPVACVHASRNFTETSCTWGMARKVGSGLLIRQGRTLGHK
jgi:hypothetical protein